MDTERKLFYWALLFKKNSNNINIMYYIDH